MTPEAEIRARIASRGQITFAEFMEVALYHPDGGYYSDARAFGAAGDYYTSPAAHPAFGALIAIQLQHMWEVLGRPNRFHAVDLGAGSGLLAGDVVRYVAGMPGLFHQSLTYIAVDRYPSSLGSPIAQPMLQHLVSTEVPLRGVVGCFICNELVDSFPVHRFQVQRGAVREVYVGIDEGGGFVDVLGEPSTPLIVQRLDNLNFDLTEGFRGEVNLGVAPWITGISRALQRGFVITIDYGHEADQLYSFQRAKGTILTYSNHTWGRSPYQHIGRQDITAQVDFSNVASEGLSLGLNSLGLRTQSQFLRSLGLTTMLEALRVKQLGQRERNANMMAMRELVKPDGLGSFKVLVQERSSGVKDLNELAPPKSALDETDVPLLRPEHITLLEGRYPHLAWDIDELWPPTESGL